MTEAKQQFEAWYDDGNNDPLPDDYTILGKRYLYMGYSAGWQRQQARIDELEEQLSILKQNPLCDTSCILACTMEADAFEIEHQKVADMKDAMLEVKRQIESNRVWSGMKHTYTPMPEFKQLRCIEAINKAMSEKGEIMELKKERTQQLVLDVIVNGEVTTYGVQALFTLGTKQGETPHKKWSFADNNMTIEEAEYSLNQFKEDGIEARIVKITTKAEVI